jgi:hypothetical protein
MLKIISTMFSKLVRKCAMVGALSFSMLSAAGQKSLADRSFVINNQNKQIIGTVHTKLPNGNRWSSTGRIIMSGNAVRMNLNTSECVIDIQVYYVVTKAGVISFDSSRVNICEQNTVGYTGDGGDYTLTDPATIQAETTRQYAAAAAYTESLRNASQIYGNFLNNNRPAFRYTPYYRWRY